MLKWSLIECAILALSLLSYDIHWDKEAGSFPLFIFIWEFQTIENV
jgi:hypothetical protein